VLEPHRSSNGPGAVFEIPGGPHAPGQARRALDGLTETLTPDLQEKARLLVSELVTNSVRHADAGPAETIGLTVAVSSSDVRVEVIDPGPGFVPPEQPGDRPVGGGGLGLRLVELIASRWGVEPGHSTRVWFELEVEPEQV
jgi:anti-sigma regulatory factor (Ser/Thr protein kinase)